MKNIKRLFLLATLVIVAIVIFEVDYNELKAEFNENLLVAANE